jgi:hypothetical protein
MKTRIVNYKVHITIGNSNELIVEQQALNRVSALLKSFKKFKHVQPNIDKYVVNFGYSIYK